MDSGVSHFGDRRLDEAGRFLHDRLVQRGPRGISVRSAGGNRAGEVRIGRFLRNDKVTVAKIVVQAALGTASRVDGLHVLSIQDMTSFRDDGSGNRLVGHATIAVEAESGALLGRIAPQILERFGSGGEAAEAPGAWREAEPARDGQHAGECASADVGGPGDGGCRPGRRHIRDVCLPARRFGGPDPGGAGPRPCRGGWQAPFLPGEQAGGRTYGRIARPSRPEETRGPDLRTFRQRHPEAAKEQASWP